MNIQELIKLADLLDSKGEHDAASEIDRLIKSAVEPTDPNIEQPEWTGEEDTATSIPPEEMEDDPTEPDFDEEEQAKWD